MKTLKYELKQHKRKAEGLQFIHDYFLSYLVKAGIDKFNKMLAENHNESIELLNRAKKEKSK